MRWLLGALGSLLGTLAILLIAMGVSAALGTSHSSESTQKFAPGVHAIMRHASSPGAGDPAAFTLQRCDTQRNLNVRGRDQAVLVGKYFRDHPFYFTAVYSSQWCRCKDTALLMGLGASTNLPALNSFFNNEGAGGPQTQALRQFLIQLGPRDKVLLVTHQLNIKALTGVYPQPGEIVFFTIQPTGKVTVVERLKPQAMVQHG
ncbi:histidine phosphatase family protein [Limnobacter humi]|uniref:Histidine phosphatase family protein n=1 Tax=Limnobacter humi TaxID=1778671 RepID=A0ABT1WDF8_9BURK|nr:histidine phosphatase family protein [Limnobacter humi]MCQ8895561.1 histidine phosphatase family protein [Limnobacter humi]